MTKELIQPVLIMLLAFATVYLVFRFGPIGLSPSATVFGFYWIREQIRLRNIKPIVDGYELTTQQTAKALIEYEKMIP